MLRAERYRKCGGRRALSFRHRTLRSIWRRAGRPKLPVLARERPHPSRPAVYARSRVIWRPILSRCPCNLKTRVHTECIRYEYRMHTKCIRNAYQLGIRRVRRRWACATPEYAQKDVQTHRARSCTWPAPSFCTTHSESLQALGPDASDLIPPWSRPAHSVPGTRPA